MSSGARSLPFGRFRDRSDAGRVLAESVLELALAQRWPRPLVLGLPRGGVPVAVPVARALGCELDALVVRKLAVPGRDELAIGALAGLGAATELVRESHVIGALDVDDARFAAIETNGRSRLADLEWYYRGSRPIPSVTGRAVVIVDDGIATGATMTAAVRLVRRLGAARTVAAAPVGAPEACRALSRSADRVVCVLQPKSFISVSSAYRDFDAPSEQSVRAALVIAPRDA